MLAKAFVRWRSDTVGKYSDLLGIKIPTVIVFGEWKFVDID